MYEVLEDFTDLQDNNHVYHKGQPFPREGVEVSKDRLAALQSARNARGRPVIKAVGAPKAAKAPGDV